MSFFNPVKIYSTYFFVKKRTKQFINIALNVVYITNKQEV